MKALTAGIVILAVLLGLTWIFEGNNFFLYKYFAPRQAAVERQVFENTRSFNQGMIQELQNMEFDYEKEKDPQAKVALGQIILHRASGFNLDQDDVPQDLRAFISQLREAQ